MQLTAAILPYAACRPGKKWLGAIFTSRSDGPKRGLPEWQAIKNLSAWPIMPVQGCVGSAKLAMVISEFVPGYESV